MALALSRAGRPWAGRAALARLEAERLDEQAGRGFGAGRQPRKLTALPVLQRSARKISRPPTEQDDELAELVSTQVIARTIAGRSERGKSSV